MALTFTDLTVDTRTVRAIEIGTATGEYITEDSLSWFDKEHLEAALALPSLAEYVMPNTGVTADVYFAPFIFSLEQLTTRYQKNRIRANPEKAIRDLENAVTEETPDEPVE